MTRDSFKIDKLDLSKILDSIMSNLFDPSYNFSNKMVDNLIDAQERISKFPIDSISYKGAYLYRKNTHTKRHIRSVGIEELSKDLVEEFNTIIKFKQQVNLDFQFIHTHLVRLIHLFGSNPVLKLLPQELVSERWYKLNYVPTKIVVPTEEISLIYNQIKEKIDYYASTKLFY